MDKSKLATNDADMQVSRRQFFLRATLLSGGVAATALSAKHVIAAPSVAPATKTSKGYQATSHVRRYYDIARQI